MKKTLKIAFALILIVSAVLTFGIMSAGATDGEIDTITVANSTHQDGTKIEYDPSTKTMTFKYVGKSSYYEMLPAVATTSDGTNKIYIYDTVVQDFIDKYRNDVEHVEVGFFGKIQLIDVFENGTGKRIGCAQFLQGMANLKSVHFAEGQRITIGKGAAEGGGIFSDCPKLTTVWYGSDENKIEGCANFTGANIENDDNWKDYNGVPTNLFKGCVSLESVIYTQNPYEFAILSTTFSGCASLKEITFGSNITSIASDAFDNCGVLVINAPEGSAAAEVTLPSLLERIEKFKVSNQPVNYGYCRSSKTVDGVLQPFDTDIKWEVYNLGTSAVPKYTIYFWQDTESGNTPHDAATPTITSLSTVLYANATSAQRKYINASNSYVVGGDAGDYGSGIYHVWHSENVPATSISTIIVDDGIKKLGYNRGTFSGMTGVEVIELPKTMTQMQGAQLKGCASLETLYTRGVSTPIIGTVNLSNFSSIPMGMDYDNPYYGFAGLKSVKQYVFKSSLNIKSTPAPCTFYDNESLTSIVLPEKLASTGASMFTNCLSLKSVTFPSTCTTIVAKTFENCPVLSEVIISNGDATIAADSSATAITGRPGATADLAANAFRNCPTLKTITAPFGSDVWNFAVLHGFHTTHSFVTSEMEGRFTFYPDTNHLTIIDTGYNSKDDNWRQFSEKEEALLLWLAEYKPLVETVEFGKFGKVVVSVGTESIFENMTALRQVQFAANQRFAIAGSLDNTEANSHGLFKNCSALTTVWLGDDSFKQDNVIDLSYVNVASPDQDNSGNILYNMFNGCSAIETVKLPKLSSYYKNNALVEPRVWASTFKGCTELKKVNIPEGICRIENGSFKDCTALTTIDFYAPASLIGASTFTGSNTDLVIKCQSYESANAVNGVLLAAGISPSSTRAFYKNGISIRGYQVRTSGYNGLRTVFSLYENAFEGYKLVECGTITATKANWDLYEESYNKSETSILKLVDGEFVTPAENVIKTAVYMNDGYVKNHIKTEGGADFTVTVINFADKNQFMADIVNCGYEIWEKDGIYYVYFTREEAKGYETTSLYKITLAMLRSRTIVPEKGINPVWSTLMGCDYTTFSANEGIQGYYFADPLDSAKKIAVYMTDSTEPIELTDIGFDLSEKPAVSAMVCGKNVKYDQPLIDGYWQEHIDSQLASLPAGRSFIAITDTHYQSGGLGNVGKSADLIQYVRSVAGIDKVINLGDPHHGEDTYSGALEQLSRSMEKKFFTYFGDDGLYAIGNHDSNITSARGAEDDNSDTYKMDLILSDTDIYNTTFAYIEEGGANNGNVIYDEELINRVKELEGKIPAFKLDNVSAEDAGKYSNLFGSVDYTAEQMYENLLAWAKMHYAYYDHENYICYIVLNTGGLTLTDFATLGRELWKFHPSQYDFLATVLNKVALEHPEYDVVVAGHMLYDASEVGNSYNSALFSMLSAFEGGTSVSFSATGGNELSGKLFGCEDGEKSRSFSYDFKDNGFKGEIICVTGHRHLDLQIVSQTSNDSFQTSVAYDSVADSLSDNAVLCLMLNQDNANESTESGAQDPVVGTITEQCFTIFTITENNTIVMTRIGANSGWTSKTLALG